MVSRVGSSICVALGIATVVVPMVSGHIGMRLGTQIAARQSYIDESSVEIPTVEPHSIDTVNAVTDEYHKDCFWGHNHDYKTYEASDSTNS